jgi:ADP-heptose:LPS heptosyltransferase
VRWPRHGTEIERCLALTDALGAPRAGLQLDFPLTDIDRRDARSVLAEAGVEGRFAIVHPGSPLPSRRWAPDRFAAVADALAAHGCTVLATGSAAESPLTAAVLAASHRPHKDLGGRTPTLGSLGALVESASIVVANDAGISHIAAALRTPSVIVSCGSEVPRWAPLDRQRHRIQWRATPCRPCAHVACPTAHECAAAIEATTVIDSALDLLESLAPCPTAATCAS